jgi:Lar family restriction alleviation protein
MREAAGIVNATCLPNDPEPRMPKYVYAAETLYAAWQAILAAIPASPSTLNQESPAMTNKDVPQEAVEAALLPCPFCGNKEVRLTTNNYAGMSWVACPNCGLEAPTETGVSADDAVTYWNRRPASPAPDRVELTERVTGNLAPGWELEFINPRAKGARSVSWTTDPAALLGDIEEKLSSGLLLWSIRPVAELRALSANDKRIAEPAEAAGLVGPVKGEGFVVDGGGFAFILVGERKFTADEVRSALAPSKDRIAELEAENADLKVRAGRFARMWSHACDISDERGAALYAAEAELSRLRSSQEGVKLVEALAEVEAGIPGAFWHVAKGRLTATEPLYAALILSGDEEIGSGESEDADEAVRIALLSALDHKPAGGV